MEDLRGAILACNDGNVFLTEAPDADGVPRIRVIAARDPLPRTHPADCAFHSNQAFVAATRAKEAFAVFPTPSGNTLVVPTKSFTSIRDFARRSTKQEFADLFRAVFKVRAAANTRTGRQHWIETIGYDVPHLHLRVVTNRVHHVRFCNFSFAKYLKNRHPIHTHTHTHTHIHTPPIHAHTANTRTHHQYTHTMGGQYTHTMGGQYTHTMGGQYTHNWRQTKHYIEA
jgi:hypothetical protein